MDQENSPDRQKHQLGNKQHGEKGTEYCKLSVVRALIAAGKVSAAASAFGGARELGINDLAGMCGVVMSLTPTDLYKSMTTHADLRIWQDVHHARPPKSLAVASMPSLDMKTARRSRRWLW
jgi:motility quorum-sensing regulator / GCU-specific mRNA interferase toxin